MADNEYPTGRVRRPDPTLGRDTTPPPQPPQFRSTNVRGAHRRRADRDVAANEDGEVPTEPEDSPRPARTRVVLADPRQQPSSMRPRVELEQSSSWGTGMVGDLARQQLRAAVGVAAVVVAALGVLPLAYFLWPAFASLRVLDVPLAWLLLGVVPFPVLFGAGMYYSRIADRHERVFVEMFDG